MVQKINVLWNNSFVNPSRLPFVCEKTGAVALVQLGLMAGRQSSSQADEMLLHLEIFKIVYWTNYWIFIDVQKSTM